MKGPAQLATYIAALLVGGGFLIIVLAWSGAAERNSLPQQFPYLLSGGLTGLGMIVAGMIVLTVQAARMQTAQRARLMRELNTAMSRLVAVSRAVRDGAPATADLVVEAPLLTLNGQIEEPAPTSAAPAPGDDTAVLAATAPLEQLPAPLPRSRPAAAPPAQSQRKPASGSSRATTGSSRASNGKSGAAPAPRKRITPSQKIVVVGRSSFHDPACRLVADRDDLPEVTRKEAVANGRAPCRICGP